MDFLNGDLLIHESMVRGEYKDSTKTNTQRTINLDDRALAILKIQRKFTLMCGVDALIFENPTDERACNDERDFRRSYWTPTLRRIGVRYRRPYQLRHTNASMRLMSGQMDGYAADQMGHSIEMFSKIYARWIKGQHNTIERNKMNVFVTANIARPLGAQCIKNAV